MSKQRLFRQVRQVDVTDPIVAAAGGFDYTDAFEVRLPVPDQEPPETWVRAGMGDTPAWVDWVAAVVLGIRDTPDTTADELAGGQVVESTSEVVHLEYSLPLMAVTVVGRRMGPSGRRLTTGLRFTRPRLARAVWAVVGRGHRFMARRLLAGHVADASSAAPKGNADRAA
jgi:hypothetical protein